jgi:DNA-directed RNA polymerase subunit E'/Rpb7
LQAIVYMPFKGEVVEGIVRSVSKVRATELTAMV